MGMSEVEKLIEIYNHLEDAGLMVIAGKKDSAELMVSHDVIPVVRCKDCKHWVYTDETWGDCTNPRFHIPGIVYATMNCDEYCASGERRNNEN